MAQVLRYLPAADDPRVLVDALTHDDAAVYRMSDDRATVVTVDFFTPIVDDAYTFGAIAATNALSDLYAMGATPLFALNLVAWPRDPDVFELIGDTVRGSVDKVREAGIFILGGHSIEDNEPKFGMVAIGQVHPDHILSNRGARPGDLLVLTKPIGTGILSTALKRAIITENQMTTAVRSMTTLNAGAMRAIRATGDGVHAVTDVTGFGLLGHLHNMLETGDVGARLFTSAVPVFDDVLRLIADGAVPGGTNRNREAANRYANWSTIDDLHRIALCDAQTSGGILVAVAPGRVDALVAALGQQHAPASAVIGEILPRGEFEIDILHDTP